MRRFALLLLLMLAVVGCTSAESEPEPADAVFAPMVSSGGSTADPAAAYPAPTGNADANVEYVSAEQDTDGTWTFSVTVSHPDTGWEDYADGWDVVLPDGTVVLPNPDDPFTRLLLHPHENEQPFTRNQSGIAIPADVTSVTVRAHDLVDGFGGATVTVDLSAESGPQFDVNPLP